MSRLPVPGQDDDVWGQILNDFLEVSNNNDGTFKTSAITQAGGIVSVNGQTTTNGSITLTAANLGIPTTLAGDSDVAISSPSNDQVLTYDSTTGQWVNQISPSAPVTSVAGRTGAITLVESDIANLTSDLAGKLLASNNLSDVASASSARTNLGLGTAATENVGTTSGTVMAGNQAAGGDLSGTLPNPTVAKLNGITAPSVAPTGAGQVLTSTSTSASAWSTPSTNASSIDGVTVTGTPTAGEALLATSGTAAAWGGVSGTLDWLNVVAQYGADPTGTNDSTTAIQNALNAAYNPSGGSYKTVYFPAGTYVTSAPLVAPPGVAWRGASGNTFSLSDYGTVIKPSASWAKGSAADAAIILMLSQSTASYSGTSEEQKFFDLMIDGSNLTPSGVNGIEAYGNVGCITINHVDISFTTGIGLYGAKDASNNSTGAVWEVNRLTVHRSGTTGINLTATDSTWTDCYVIGSGQKSNSDGWVLATSSNSTFVGCRSEDSIGGNGFTYTCSNSLANGISFVGCSTQGNYNYGFQVSQNVNSGCGPVKFVGCNFNDDGTQNGSGGGGYAALYITNYPNVVQIVGCSITTGTQTGGGSPEYGLKIASNTNGRVVVSNSTIAGYTAPVSDDHSSAQVTYDATTVLFTGLNNASPTYSMPGLSITGGTQILTTQQSSDTNARFYIDQNGKLHWGSGASTQDTDLYRSAAGVVATDAALSVGTELTAASAYISEGLSTGNLLKVYNSTSNPTGPGVQIVTAAAADNAFGVEALGDSNNRFKMDSNGKMQWGPGNAAQDTDLYRSAAGVLATDESLSIGAGLTVTGATTLNGTTAFNSTISFNDGILATDGLSVSGAALSVNVASATGQILSVTNSTASPSGSNVHIVDAAAGDNSLGIQVTGDSNNRFKMDSNGKMQWGPGSAGQDTDLYRSAAGVLATDESLSVTTALGVGITPPTTGISVSSATTGGVLRVANTTATPTTPNVQLVSEAAADSTIGVEVSGDTSNRFKMDSNGKMQWGPGNAAVDTDLYRSATDTLTTDGVFTAGTSLQAPLLTASGLTGATAASRYVGATASGAPASGTFAVGDYVVDQTGKLWVCTTAGTPGTWSQVGGGAVTSVTAADTSVVIGGTGSAPTIRTNTLDVIATDHPAAAGWSNNSQAITGVSDLAVSGLTGATAASRYVGATASGHPASGTFAVGDYVIDQTGVLWICTTAGTPGTWTGGATPTLDATATDIQMPGVQAAGATGKAADAGHVHPHQGGAADYMGAVFGWSMPIAYANGNLQGVSETLYFAQVLVPEACTTTTFNMVTTAGGGASGVTAAYAAIVNSAGTIVAQTANSSGTVPAAGDQIWQPTWTAGTALAAGVYWGAVLIEATTMPKWISGTALTNAITNLGCSAAAVNLRSASGATGITALPGSVTMTSLSNYEGPLWMAFT